METMKIGGLDRNDKKTVIYIDICKQDFLDALKKCREDRKKAKKQEHSQTCFWETLDKIAPQLICPIHVTPWMLKEKKEPYVCRYNRQERERKKGAH